MMLGDETEDERRWVRTATEEGLASGVIEKDARQVLREIMIEIPSSKGFSSSC